MIYLCGKGDSSVADEASFPALKKIFPIPHITDQITLPLRSIFQKTHFCHAENEDPLRRQETF